MSHPNDVVVITHSAPLYNLPCHKPRCLESMLYLEMLDSSLDYQRKICSYNINPFSKSIELPIVRYKNRTIIGGSNNSTIDTLENIFKNSGLNCQLSPTQKADLIALTSLIRDKLHLVTLHQIYADEQNWREYSRLMGNYLPFLPRKWLLNKERLSVLELLQKHQIISKKQAIDLLDDCLNVIYLKMNGIKALNDYSNNNNDIDNEYFFGSDISSLDAVLVSELAILSCSKASLPNIYLNDIKSNNKLEYLLNYMKNILDKYRKNIYNKLDKTQYILPPILHPRSENDKKNDKIIYTNIEWDKQKSGLFIVGSFAALALYWKIYKPVSIQKK